MSDVQNLKTHMAFVIEGLERENEVLSAEKEDLAAKLQATEKKFFQDDAAVKVFGQKAITKFTEGISLWTQRACQSPR